MKKFKVGLAKLYGGLDAFIMEITEEAIYVRYREHADGPWYCDKYPKDGNHCIPRLILLSNDPYQYEAKVEWRQIRSMLNASQVFSVAAPDGSTGFPIELAGKIGTLTFVED